jgi:hypothetical protein
MRRWKRDHPAAMLIPADSDNKVPAKKFEITGWMAGLNMAFSIAFFIFMYKYLPLLAARRN